MIAFEQISSIFNRHKDISISLYADDAFIYTNKKDLNSVKDTFSNVLDELEQWGASSGASVSIGKYQVLHICRKQNCNFPEIVFKNKAIQQTNHLKILGITFDSRLTFKEHCLRLRKQLESRLNIIKFLSSKYSHVHINTLINITRALKLSKIDYGLPIFGWIAASNIKSIQPPYHAAVRRSIYAFPTSPTKCTLAESGLPSITNRIKETTTRLIPKLYTTPNRLLADDFKNIFKERRRYKYPSTLRICANFSKKLDLPPPNRFRSSGPSPPWFRNQPNINTKLRISTKSHTPSSVHRTRFQNEKELLGEKHWLFTDGSKTLESTTFAVIDANNTIIAGGALPLYNSIFVAEATAILLACRFATSKNGELVVCTDSLSSLLAINNPEYRDPTIREIQRLTKEHPKKITLFWVPSHQGIKGNEDGDQAAHNIGLSPTFIFTPINSKDIHKLIDRNLENQKTEEWSTFTHRYCKFNPTCTKIPLPAAIGRRQCSTFIRLRIGHTKHTHEHLLKGINNPTTF